MPKWKDFINPAKKIVTAVNPVAGAVAEVVHAVVDGTKEKGKTVTKFMDGKKTYAGIIVAILPVILNLFGYSVGENFNEEAGELIDQLITLVGASYAFYGRSVTKKK